jgi:Xaa-Pro aminopeptidase
MPFDLTVMQEALREGGLDGWLFQDFRGSDPLSYSILGFSVEGHRTRRWFYYVPATGEPTKIVHSIEPGALDGLPGVPRVYSAWTQLAATLADTLSLSRRVAMQYSPNNAIPTVSRVDAGTMELVRSMGVEVVSSADLVQIFEATLSPQQFQSHLYAADKIAQICQEAFDVIGGELAAGRTPTELSIQQFLLSRFDEERLVSDHPPIVAVDAHSADPHFSPTPGDLFEMKPGNTVLIDLWAKSVGSGTIYADITRVATIGEPSFPDYANVFTIVRGARDAAIAAIQSAMANQAPMRACDLDDVCRSVIREAGYEDFFPHRTGHSIHQSPHGNGANIDNLETQDVRTLIPRTLFSIEPGIYLPGRFGIRSEINVYLSEDEAIVTGPARQTEVYRI